MTKCLETFMKENAPKIDKTLHALIDELSIPSELKKSMIYSINAGGKRVRPLLVLATLDDLDIQLDDAYIVACAVELIHTYSLIHDDLPAMDDDDYRRGKLTNHKVFGDALAILAGDAMQALAFQCLTRTTSLAPTQQVELIRLLSEASGAEGMVGGQVLDLEGEARSLNVDELEAIHVRKTGALLSFSIEAGAILAQLCDDKKGQLKRYAHHIGLAFQIKDDILDVTSTTEQLGKPANSDEAQNKSTYPALLGIDGATEQMYARYEEALDALRFLEKEDALLAQFAHYIVERTL
ncbi:MAG TPA: farnesyl diphosphate synthase [Savagea sp.]